VFETVNSDGEYRLISGSYHITAADAAHAAVAVEKGAAAPIFTKIKVE